MPQVVLILLGLAGALATLFGLLQGLEWSIRRVSKFLTAQRRQYPSLWASPQVRLGSMAALVSIAGLVGLGVLFIRDGETTRTLDLEDIANWNLLAEDDFREAPAGLFPTREDRELQSPSGKQYKSSFSYSGGAFLASVTTSDSTAAPREHFSGRAPTKIAVDGNFAAEVTVALIQSSIEFWEVGLAFETEDGLFIFAITPSDGQYHINLPIDQGTNLRGGLYAWRPTSAVNVGRQKNNIRLEVVRDTLVLRLNGEFVDAVEWPGLSRKIGTVSLGWAALGPFDGADLRVQFTQFRLYSLSE